MGRSLFVCFFFFFCESGPSPPSFDNTPLCYAQLSLHDFTWNKRAVQAWKPHPLLSQGPGERTITTCRLIVPGAPKRILNMRIWSMGLHWECIVSRNCRHPRWQWVKASTHFCGILGGGINFFHIQWFIITTVLCFPGVPQITVQLWSKWIYMYMYFLKHMILVQCMFQSFHEAAYVPNTSL